MLESVLSCPFFGILQFPGRLRFFFASVFAIKDERFKLQGTSAYVSKCHVYFLFILFLKMLHLQKCGLKY